MASLMKARWTKAASMVVPPKKKMSFLDAVRKVHARMKAAMDVEERLFHKKLMSGPNGPKLLNEADTFATELVDDCLEEVHRNDRAEVHDSLVKTLKDMQESIVLVCFNAIQQDDKELEKYKKKNANLKKIVAESQRNFMVEMVQLKELMHRDDEDEVANRVEDILMYDGLMSLDEELREAADAIIERRIRKALLAPKRLLLMNIQKLLNEGEDAIDSKNKNLNAPPGSPCISPRAKKTPAEIMAERDKQRIEELESKLKTVETNLNLAKQEFIERRNQRNRLERQCANFKADHERETEDLRKRIAEAAEGALKEQQDLEKLLKEIREQRKQELAELNAALVEKRQDLAAIRQLEASSKAFAEEKEEELERLKKAIASAELSSKSSDEQSKDVKDEIAKLKKESEKLQVDLKGLQERERALREKLTEPRTAAGQIKKKRQISAQSGGPMRASGGSRMSSKEIEQPEEVRGAWLKDLLKVLRAQMLLSTPRNEQSREWGRPLDCHALVAPTGDTDLAKIVALLNGLDVPGDDFISCQQKMCRGAPSAQSRRSPHHESQYWFLAPPIVDSAGTPGLGQSRSCTDLNSTSQSWVSCCSDAKTVSVRTLDKPPRRDFLKRCGAADPRPHSTASHAGKRIFQKLGCNKCSICGLGGGTDHCLECQSTVPRLSVGWCLPPLATEQSANSKWSC